MSNENKAVKENEVVEDGAAEDAVSVNSEATENPEGADKATETSEADEEAAVKAFAERIPDLDETASVMEEDGEIAKILDALYEACKAKNIPIFVNIIHKINKEEDGFGIEARGMEVGGENNFYPPNLMALKKVTEHKALSDMVLHVSRDEGKLRILELLNSIGS